MLYAMTGVRAISALPGCPGHTYDQRADRSDPHMSVDCPVHEAHLAKDPLWSPSAAHVPLNDAEEKASEEAAAGREKAIHENAASTSEALRDITKVLGGLVERVGAMQPQAPAPAPAVPDAAAPAAVTPAAARPASKTRAKASA